MAGRRLKIRSNSKTSPTSASEPSDQAEIDQYLSVWDDQLQELIEDHSRWHYRKYENLLQFVTEIQFDPLEDKITGRFQEHAKRNFQAPVFAPAILLSSLPTDPELYLDFNCNCYPSRYSPCEHTYALVAYLQREFNTTSLTPLLKSIFQKVDFWPAVLGKIDHILTLPTLPPAVDNNDRRDAETCRLVWRFSFHPPGSSDDPISLHPVLQTLGKTKNPKWTKGKIVAWSDLRYKWSEYLTPQDMEVVRAAQLSQYERTPENASWGKIYEALIGHPLVMVDNEFLTVRRGQVGLATEEEGDSWRLQPAVNDLPSSQFQILCRVNEDYLLGLLLGQRELVVAKSTSELLDLCTTLLRKPTFIPPESRAQLVERLPALESRMPIGLPNSLKGELIVRCDQITLGMHPRTPEGVTIDLKVTPAPGGQSFIPGQGAVEVAGRQDAARVRVERDLDHERERAQALTEELFLSRFHQTSPFCWTIDRDDDVLDLLDSLRARPENDPIVKWDESANDRQLTVLGEVTPADLKVEIKDDHDWFGLSGSIQLGGQKFPLAALLEALRGGRRYLSLGKGQFAAIAQEFRDRLASVADMLHSNKGKLGFNATAAPVIADLLDDQVTLKASKKWKSTLERLNRATDLVPQVPNTLTADLRDYQVDGFKWLRRLAEWGVGGILADDMGLGKTVQALAVLLDRREIGPILVVAPVSVGFNWQRETERFAPTLRPILYRDTDRVEFLKSLGPGDLLISSYHLVQQHAEELASVTWGTLVLDEAQAIKNSQTKTAQAIRTLEADWRLALTGTPCENHLGDLWSVFRGISPGLFGSWDRFREVFADPIEKAKVTERKQALSRVLRPFILRRTKSEVLKELPARTEIQLEAELSDAERRRYEDTRLWAVTHLTDMDLDTGKDQRFQVLAALTKLRQLACHPRLLDDQWDQSSAKLDLFLETVDELREGRHRALVFSQFTSHLAIIREALDKQKITYQYLDGQTPPKQRQERVDAFQRGQGELFLISLKAGGTGLNLTGADYVIHMDPWWNPAVEDQATDRAHRIGQTRPVTVYRLVAKDTIEEQILKLHADKRTLVAGILDGTDQAAKLSTTELLDLIKTGGRST